MADRPTEKDMELGTGLIDNFDGVVIDAYFGVDAAYAEKARASGGSGSDEPMLCLVFESPEFEQSGEQKYSIGSKGWTAEDEGKRVVSSLRPDTRVFNANSNAGMLISRLFMLAGKGDKAKGQKVFVERGHFMTEADFYKGIRSHWLRESRKNPMGGSDISLLQPQDSIEFVGVTAGKAAKSMPASDEGYADFVAEVVGLASGKTPSQLKAAIMKDAKLRVNAVMMKRLYGPLLSELEKEGVLTKKGEAYV